MSDVRTVPIDDTEPEARRAEPGLGTLIDKYVIRSRIGAGGCGTVYSAFDSVLERDVALKLLGHTDASMQATLNPSWPRLVREARMLAKLSEPEVVTVYEVGSADGQAYLAMELVQGGDLQGFIEQHRAPGAPEPLPLPRALELLEQAGLGLAVAHEAGVVHGDFKPANVLIDARGRAKVSDFGIARLARAVSRASEGRGDGDGDPLDTEDPDPVRTVSSTGLAGTPAYMAPEQFERRPADVASDIYAYCTTLYQAVYGRLPFQARTVAEIAARKVTSHPEFPSHREVPRWLVRLLDRGLQIDPQQRPKDMREVLQQLSRWRRRPGRRWFVLGGSLLGAAAVTAAMWMGEEAQPCPMQDATLGWDDSAARAVQKSFATVGGASGKAVARRVTDRMDEFAQTWRQAHQEACRTAWGDPQLGAQAFACLRRRRRVVEALAAAWIEPTNRTVDAAVSAIEAMPSVQACLDPEALATAPDLPEDPVLREEVIGIGESLDAAIATARTGAVEQAVQLASQAQERATQTGHEPVIGRAMLALGQAHELAGELEAAREELQQAFFMAQRWDDPETAAAAAERLAYLVGTRLEEHEQGLLWSDHAKVALGKTGGSTAVLLGNEGSILERLGRYDEALQRYEASLREHDPDDAYGLGVTHLRTGDALRYQGRSEDALSHYEHAAEAWARALGPEHPRLSIPTLSRATALAKLGRIDDAVPMFEQAIEGLTRAFGPEHPNVAAARMNLGVTLKNAGRHDEAEASLREAVRINVEIYGEDHLKVAQTREAVGRLLTKAGRPDEAIVEHEQARARFEAELPEGHPDRVLVHLNLGDAHLAAGQHDQAIAAYELGVAETKALPEDAVLRGDALAYLGRGLATAGRCEEARPKLQEAQRRLHNVEVYEDGLALAREWLAKCD